MFDLSLPADRQIPTDAKGDIVITDPQARLLAWIGQNDEWADHPDFRGHTLDCYLTVCLRVIYRAPDHVIELVHAELAEDHDRRRRPHPRELLRMCVAAMEVRPYLRGLGIVVDPIEEPPPTRKHRRVRRVRLDD